MIKSLSVFLTAIAVPVLAFGGVCEKTWDGDKLSFIGNGKSSLASIRLTDQVGRPVDSITVGQIRAFQEAKDGIARVVGTQPNFIVCDEQVPNAFAMPGKNGDIIGVTIGMLKLVNGDRDMAAEVIGHEYAHHTRRHLQSSQLRNTVIEVIGLIAGIALEYKIQQRSGVQNLGLDLGQMGANLASRKFDRDQEREADEVGFDYVVKAGFNPEGAIRLANLMNQRGLGGSGYFFDSHPGWDERASRFKNLIASNPEAIRLASISKSQSPTNRSASATDNTVLSLLPTYQVSDAQKAYIEGVAAFNRKDIAEGVKHLRSAADSNYAPAMAIVGYLYMNGIGGLTKDEAEGIRILRLAADQGDALAQANLGFAYANGRGGLQKDESEAVRLFMLSAEQGNGQGRANLGFMYSFGKGGLQKDTAEAFRLYKLSADQGNAQGEANLGQLYLQGRDGVEKNEYLALELFKRAAGKGNALGANNLAVMYRNGFGGVKKDDAEAARLFRIAANQGIGNAQALLGEMLINGTGIQADQAEGLRYVQSSVSQNNPIGQATLGFLYLNGKAGLSKDQGEAVRLFQLSAAQGHPLGKNNLGVAYENGWGGLEKDREKALALYREAAEAGLPLAKKNQSRLECDKGWLCRFSTN